MPLRDVMVRNEREYTEEELASDYFDSRMCWDKKKQVYCVYCLNKEII